MKAQNIRKKVNVKNKYNLTMSDVKKLKVNNEMRYKLKGPMFWRNEGIKAWCISKSFGSKKDIEFCTNNDFWIGIYDIDAPVKVKFRVTCSSYGGMRGYNFKNFFDYSEIENELDLQTQEGLLETINFLIDEKILIIEK